MQASSSSGLGPLTENRKSKIENRKYEPPNPDSNSDSGLGLDLVIGFGPYLRPGFSTLNSEVLGF